MIEWNNILKLKTKKMISREDGLELLKLAKIPVRIYGDVAKGEGVGKIPDTSLEFPISYLNNDVFIIKTIKSYVFTRAYETGYKDGKASLKETLETLLQEITEPDFCE